ncbi:hypothetical protein ACS0TY_021346 [Phlomoides rotata]
MEPVEVLQAIADYPELKFLYSRTQGPQRPKSDKFCRFHNEYEHDTNNYDEINRMIQAGHLKEFVYRDRQEDRVDIQGSHNDALVITTDIAGYDVTHIFVDSGSSVYIMFLEYFKRMDLNAKLEPINTIIYGFSGGSNQPMMANFLIVDIPLSYNVVFGRPILNLFQAVVSTFHMKMKFSV